MIACLRACLLLARLLAYAMLLFWLDCLLSVWHANSRPGLPARPFSKAPPRSLSAKPFPHSLCARPLYTSPGGPSVVLWTGQT